MTVTDLASDIWREELNEDSSVSIAAVAQYLRTHIGDLNNSINQGFYINNSYEIIDENGDSINVDAASVYKKLFEIYWFKKQSKAFLGANGVDSISQITQDGITFRGVERNGIAKTYVELLKNAKDDLRGLINNYKFNRARAGHVVSDDYISKYDVGE